MTDARIVTETELRRAVPLDLAAIEAVEQGFRRLAQGGVVMPPILSMHMADANGEVDVKTAYVPGLAGFAVKISPGFFDNPKRGLASTSGLMVVLSAETGRAQAVLLDNGYLTDVRTAAAGAVAARALSRPDSRRVAIIGAGMQARMQLAALRLVRPIDVVTIWARDPAKAQAMADEVGGTAATSTEAAMTDADIIVTTTPTSAPILRADWLRPGQHVTAMGSDQPGKAELDPRCLTRADLYVPDRLSQTRIQGELRAAVAAGLIAPDATFPELGEVLIARHPGRTAPDQITIADLTGTGVQDTAIANHALRIISEEETDV